MIVSEADLYNFRRACYSSSFSYAPVKSPFANRRRLQRDINRIRRRRLLQLLRAVHAMRRQNRSSL